MKNVFHRDCYPGYLRLYFSAVGGEIHGPLHFRPDERVEQIHQWLDGETFRCVCTDEETNECVAHTVIMTNCGMVLDESRNLEEYPVSNGDALTVIVLPSGRHGL